MESKAGRILIVDDEFSVRDSLYNWFVKDNYDVVAVEDGESALHAIVDNSFDVALLDIKMPGMDGMELQRRLQKAAPELLVIMITAFASVETAVVAMKHGAFDYVTKPIDPDELSHLVKRAVEKRRLVQENVQLRRRLDDIASADILVGESPPMKNVVDLIHQVADTDATVLIRGESGTGKELIARAIHANSSRRYFPIVPVNSGALPESLLESELFGHEKGAFTGAHYRRKGKLEMANGGTLFLDEIGTIGAKTQVDLLRVLESKELTRLGGSRAVHVDFRVVCATNADLEQLVSEGAFREDLYYRINVFAIDVPPLRDRRSDIPLLAKHFCSTLAMQMDKRIGGISAGAMEALMAHDWPGNVRELANAIERAMVVGRNSLIDVADLPFLGKKEQAAFGRGQTLAEVEMQHINRVLSEDTWNISRAARDLGIDRATLYAKIRKYKLHKPDALVSHRPSL